MKTKNLSKKIIIIVVMILLLNILASVFSISFAAESTTKIVLSDSGITVNGEAISTDSSNTVYLSTSTNNGGTSEDATSASIETSNGKFTIDIEFENDGDVKIGMTASILLEI